MDRVLQLMDRVWILSHYETLVSMPASGCRYMFLNDKWDDAKLLYTLFSRCPQTLKSVHKIMTQCIKEAGNDILGDTEKVKDPVVFIKAILSIFVLFLGAVNQESARKLSAPAPKSRRVWPWRVPPHKLAYRRGRLFSVIRQNVGSFYCSEIHKTLFAHTAPIPGAYFGYL